MPCIAEIASKGSVAMRIETLNFIGLVEIEGRLIEIFSGNLHWFRFRSGADRPAQRERFLLKQHGTRGNEFSVRLLPSRYWCSRADELAFLVGGEFCMTSLNAVGAKKQRLYKSRRTCVIASEKVTVVLPVQVGSRFWRSRSGSATYHSATTE